MRKVQQAKSAERLTGEKLNLYEIHMNFVSLSPCLSVQHDGVDLVGLLRHRYESVLGVAHSEHSRCGVQVMTRPPGPAPPPTSPNPAQPRSSPSVTDSAHSTTSEGMMGKKSLNSDGKYGRV